jgi:hypothetical protein
LLGLLESNRLLRQRDEAFELTSASLLPRIRDWASERAALEQARAETIRQIARVRDSALRGMIGGAIGFALAFLLTYYGQTENKALLSYITAYRALPGALGGLLLTLSIDVALASYHGPQRRMRWVLGGVSGAVAFALALVFHALFRLRGDVTSLLLISAQGGLWGFVTGVCTISMMTTTRPPWQTLPASVFACALVLEIGETFGNAFQNANLGEVFGAGIVMPLFVISAALLPRWWKETKA